MVEWTKMPQTSVDALLEIAESVQEDMEEGAKSDLLESYGVSRETLERVTNGLMDLGWETLGPWAEEVGVKKAMAAIMMSGVLVGIKFNILNDHLKETERDS